MDKGRLLLAVAALGMPLCANQAQAAVGFRPERPPSIMQSADRANCEVPVQPAYGESQTSSIVPAVSKSTAILSGHTSQLDLITRQQSSPEATRLTPIALTPPGLAGGMKLGRVACMRATAPKPGAIAFALPMVARPLPAAIAGTPRNPEDFLASKRLPISRTNFDASWNRVRGGSVGLYASGPKAAQMGGPMSLDRLRSVNAWTNARIRYVEDSVLYGKADYWADAGTTLKRRAGDCEDIAIAKMQLLSAMGIPQSDLYLTIARDLVRNADHAVLIVKLGDRHWMLDNSTDEVLDAAASHDYRPIMSFSASRKWLHGY